MKIRVTEVASPVGDLLACMREEFLCGLAFPDAHAALTRDLSLRYPGARRVRERAGGGITRSLRRYFAGELTSLDEIPVELGGTPFQQAVWQALREVPVGQTRSYSDVARRIGRPAAVRAVGTANRQNPVAVVVPCHRIIRKGGDLCGYGGGVERKRWLLVHEGALPPA